MPGSPALSILVVRLLQHKVGPSMPCAACRVMFKDACYNTEIIVAAGARVSLQKD